MMTHGIGVLLLTAVAGYWVLERATAHKGELQRIGRLLGSVVIVVSLIGIGCTVASLAAGGASRCYLGCGPMGKAGMKGASCPMMSHVKPSVPPAASVMPSHSQKER